MLSVQIIAIVSVFGLPAILGGMFAYFKHRENMARLIGAKSDSSPNPQLLARIEALEKKCDKLQDQVNAAHLLIHDEQRMLDLKLAEVIEKK